MNKLKLIFGLLVLAVALSCQSKGTAPQTYGPTPTEAQQRWHELETYAFIHFGLNTYNDLEWGYGDTSEATFNPDTLDVKQWVETLQKAGMKGIILTSKHHDGFCLWQTETTEYSVKNSPWKNGKGDLVKDLSDECRKAGLKFGIYLSPWDRHNKNYGNPVYVDSVFHQQIKELTTNYGKLFEYWFDGANGGNGWYGGANETRSITPNTYYKYEEAVKLLQKNNPDIMIFGGTVPTIRWVGNERGWAGETNYCAYDYKMEENYHQAQWGMSEATKWIPAEVDVSIRPGWFYHHREDHQVRSVANLVKLYYQSVGRNANLLLNCPIALNGRIPKTDSINLMKWREHLDKSFKNNILKGIEFHSTATREGSLFETKHLTDEQNGTYWASRDSIKKAELIAEFPEQEINTIALKEHIALGQRVEKFSIYYDKQGKWETIPTLDSLTTIGYKRLISFKRIKTSKLKLSIDSAKAEICLNEISAYNTPDLVEAPNACRNADNKLYIWSLNPQAKLSYREEGGEWQEYSEPCPMTLEGVNLEIKAILGKAEATTKLMLPYRANNFTSKELDLKQLSALLDTNINSVLTLEPKQRAITLQSIKAISVKSIIYTPNQWRDAQGHIRNYELYLDNKLVKKGEFSNIRNNPIPTTIELDKAYKCRQIKLVAKSLEGEAQRLSISDLAIYQ